MESWLHPFRLQSESGKQRSFSWSPGFVQLCWNCVLQFKVPGMKFYTPDNKKKNIPSRNFYCVMLERNDLKTVILPIWLSEICTWPDPCFARTARSAWNVPYGGLLSFKRTNQHFTSCRGLHQIIVMFFRLKIDCKKPLNDWNFMKYAVIKKKHGTNHVLSSCVIRSLLHDVKGKNGSVGHKTFSKKSRRRSSSTSLWDCFWSKAEIKLVNSRIFRSVID